MTYCVWCVMGGARRAWQPWGEELGRRDKVSLSHHNGVVVSFSSFCLFLIIPHTYTT